MSNVFCISAGNFMRVVVLLAAASLGIANAGEPGRPVVNTAKPLPSGQKGGGLAAVKPSTPPAVSVPYAALKRETLPGLRELSGEFARGQTQKNDDRNISERDNSAEAGNDGSAQVFLLAAALCAALAGTTVVLYVISKRPNQKEEINTVSSEVNEEIPVREAVPAVIEQKPVVQKDFSVVEEPAAADPAVELARRFQRGRGEMQLLLNMQTRDNEEAPVVQLLQIAPQTAAKGKNRKSAKKIDIGKGEAELLTRLHQFGASANHPQRML